MRPHKRLYAFNAARCAFTESVSSRSSSTGRHGGCSGQGRLSSRGRALSARRHLPSHASAWLSRPCGSVAEPQNTQTAARVPTPAKILATAGSGSDRYLVLGCSVRSATAHDSAPVIAGRAACLSSGSPNFRPLSVTPTHLLVWASRAATLANLRSQCKHLGRDASKACLAATFQARI